MEDIGCWKCYVRNSNFVTALICSSESAFDVERLFIRSQIVAAFDPSLADKNGAYLEDSNIASPAPHADPTNKVSVLLLKYAIISVLMHYVALKSLSQDVQDLAQKLWDFTETSVGERFPL